MPDPEPRKPFLLSLLLHIAALLLWIAFALFSPPPRMEPSRGAPFLLADLAGADAFPVASAVMEDAPPAPRPKGFVPPAPSAPDERVAADSPARQAEGATPVVAGATVSETVPPPALPDHQAAGAGAGERGWNSVPVALSSYLQQQQLGAAMIRYFRIAPKSASALIGSAVSRSDGTFPEGSAVVTVPLGGEGAAVIESDSAALREALERVAWRDVPRPPEGAGHRILIVRITASARRIGVGLAPR